MNARNRSSKGEEGRSAPGLFVCLFIVFEGLFEAAQNLGGRFEHRLQLRFVHLLDVLAQMVPNVLEGPLHLLRMVPRIAVCRTCHIQSRSCCRPPAGASGGRRVNGQWKASFQLRNPIITA
jgi:hypothetical protein